MWPGSPVPATRWPVALALQRAASAPIRLRIGVHTGEVRLRDDANYAGSAINRTARLRELAHGGQTVISGATEALVADGLPDGVWLAYLGTHQLRDLPRAERVLQLCHPDLCNEFPPLRNAQIGCLSKFAGPADKFRRAPHRIGRAAATSLPATGWSR